MPRLNPKVMKPFLLIFFCHSVLNCVAIDLPYNFEEILRHATHVEISQSSLTMLDGQSI